MFSSHGFRLECKNWMKSKWSVPVSYEWTKHCVEWILNEFGERNLTIDKIRSELFNQWLHTDLTVYGKNALDDSGRIPSESSIVNGSFAIQINSFIDVSKSLYSQLLECFGEDCENMDIDCNAPPVEKKGERKKRLLSFTLTDGYSIFKGIEKEYMSSLNSENLFPGVKVLLTGPFEVDMGCILLKPQNIRVLGGFVEELVRDNCKTTLLIKSLKMHCSNSDLSRFNKTIQTYNDRTARLNETAFNSDLVSNGPNPATHASTSNETLGIQTTGAEQNAGTDNDDVVMIDDVEDDELLAVSKSLCARLDSVSDCNEIFDSPYVPLRENSSNPNTRLHNNNTVDNCDRVGRSVWKMANRNNTDTTSASKRRSSFFENEEMIYLSDSDDFTNLSNDENQLLSTDVSKTGTACSKRHCDNDKSTVQSVSLSPSNDITYSSSTYLCFIIRNMPVTTCKSWVVRAFIMTITERLHIDPVSESWRLRCLINDGTLVYEVVVVHNVLDSLFGISAAQCKNLSCSERAHFERAQKLKWQQLLANMCAYMKLAAYPSSPNELFMERLLTSSTLP